ncbi:hypothetical protein SK128_025139 [Halocaridina rubra]|uniref:LEM domain-containing protein n=1 Tax=Halocaridina rubra TaxID=373956 RepID=A0AAN9A8E6_HALRR
MTSLTKDQLKNALVTHGVELPSPSARKEAYLRLYEEFVAPTGKSKSDFSSDEEDIVPVEQNNMDQSLIVDGFDISSLSDYDLYNRLQEFGATVGPIVDSTRKVYQRKLYVLLGGDVVDSPPAYNGDVADDDDEEYSDNDVEEDVEEIEETVQTRSSSRLESSKSSPSTQNRDLRKRVLVTSEERSSGDVVFDPDRHTPSPRPSLRSVTSTTTTHSSTESFRTRKYVNNGGSGLFNATGPETLTEQEEEKERQSKISLLVRLFVKLLFLALIIALLYYVYQNDPEGSPFKPIQHLVKHTLEMAVGEEAEAPAGKQVSDTPEAAPLP